VSPPEEPPDPAVPVSVPLEDSFDLHSFRPADVPSAVSEYLDEARGSFREVRLIHGRGIGVQREIVRSLLSRRQDVARFFDAPAERGGWGATVVVFR
jgi:dsDNA-specific endonuclease/ATPase MutS2